MLLKTCLLFASVVLSHAAKPLTQADKDKFLEVHNQLRKATGSGEPDLVWDDTLAEYAAGLVDKCKWGHDPAHKNGENIFMAYPAKSAIDAAEAASKKWGKEINNVDPDWKCAYGKKEPTCGHYSQQVWKGTKKIGCAAKDCDMKGRTWTMVFCEYAPKGNRVGYDIKTHKSVLNRPY